MCYIAEWSRDGLDTRYDDQHNQRCASSWWRRIIVFARLYSAACSLCHFHHHRRRIPLPCLQTSPSSLRGIFLIGDLKLSKKLKEKLLGSDREGLGIRIADLNQIADLKLSILAVQIADLNLTPYFSVLVRTSRGLIIRASYDFF